MPEFVSKTHKVIVTPDGIMEIYPVQGRTIKESIISPDGKVRIIEHTVKTESNQFRALIEELDIVPLLKAAYAGDGTFHVDMDCGATRWKGSKDIESLQAGLKHCGFTKEIAKGILKLCTKHTHEFMDRVG